MKEESQFSRAHKDEPMAELVRETDHQTVAIWAVDCVERMIPYFEIQFPLDHRPGKALDTLQNWINTGIFSMEDIRKASHDAHAAAREVGKDNAARSAACAAGQAVATAHVPTHSLAAATYALQAISRAENPSEADAAVVCERDWQYQHLRKLLNSRETLKRAAPERDEQK